MKPFIHIGFPKTATSWFQRRFFPEVQDIVLVNRNRILELFIYPTPFEFNADDVRSQLAGSVNKRLVISHEELVGSIRRGGYNGYITKEIACRLKETFPNAEIVITLRNQLDAIASSYVQYIRGGGTYGIDRFIITPELRSFNNMHLFSLRHLEYHHVILLYRELFGESNVHILFYEDFLNNRNKFIEGFINDFDFKINLDSVDMKKINMRYRRILNLLVQCSNHFIKGNVVNKKTLLRLPISFTRSRRLFAKLNRYKIFGHYPSTLSILGKANYNYLTEYYKASNQFLASELNIQEIRDYNYPL